MNERLLRLRDGETGMITLWMLGLCLLLLTLGGLALDLWHVVEQRRALVGAADAAAYAGASGLDTAAFRSDGELLLDPGRARALADRAVRGQLDLRPMTGWAVDAGARTVTVTVEGQVETFLLRLVSPRHASLPVTVSATAEPRSG